MSIEKRLNELENKSNTVNKSTDIIIALDGILEYNNKVYTVEEYKKEFPNSYLLCIEFI